MPSSLRNAGASPVSVPLAVLPVGRGVVPSRKVDWARLARRGSTAAVMILTVVTLVRNAAGSTYGFDFHGIWNAGHAVLVGRSPYLAADPRVLLLAGNSFVTPPLLAVLAAPFSLLPFVVAATLWKLVSLGAFVAALRLLGLRDWRLYVLAVGSFPFVSGLAVGQPAGLFALAGAVAWLYRDSWKGAVAVGALIAAKLIAWPLVLWLVITGRIRCSLIAVASAAGLLAASWATVGFKGLLDYPKLLSADAHAFEELSHSTVGWAMRVGASASLVTAIAVIYALAVALAVVTAGRRSDLGWFAGALTLGLLTSPILWSHYLVLLFVPLAISRPRLDWVWMLAATAFWLSPSENVHHQWQIALVIVTASAIAVMSARPPSGLPFAPAVGSAPAT
jgi:alpha-1,2-mannosyltransferase